MKYIILSILSLCLISCSTAKKANDFEKPALSDKQYDKLISQHTRTTEKYNGFHNLYNIKATMLNTKVNSAVIDRQRFNKQLSTSDSQRLREKAFRQMSSETHFFVSYFSPKRSLRHLDRGDALWKIYLERDGRRFEAKVIKYPGVKFDTQSLFNFHSRWSKGYLVKFKIPTSAIENTEVKLIFTSSAGQEELAFSPLN